MALHQSKLWGWSTNLVVVLLWLAFRPSTSASASDRALLIGINDYIDQRINDLRGCESDAKAMRQVLVDDYGFDASQIRVVTAPSASRKVILDAIDSWLIEGTRPGDRVLLYYSGHGSQRKCGGGKPDEPDGFDEILCPVDYNPETQANCIVDDEIARRLARLDGRNVIVIVDACHSGSITKSIKGVKGGRDRFRGVETIDTAQSVPKYIPTPGGGAFKDIFFRPPTTFAADSPNHAQAGQRRSDGSDAADASEGAQRVIDEVRANYVALTSCADAQTSEEIRVRVGDDYVRRGAFTWMLVEGLSGPADRNGDGRVTYREIIEYAQQRLRDPRYDLTQAPELRTRGAFMDQPFLGRILSSKGLGRVIEVSGDKVTINRGAQHGVSRQQTYEVAGAKRYSGDGEIQIDAVEQFLAVGRVKGQITVRPNDVVRPKGIFYNPGGLTVWIPTPVGFDSPASAHASLLQRIAGIDGIVMTDDPSVADRTVRIEQKHSRMSAAIYSRFGTLRGRADGLANPAALCEEVANRLIGELLIMQLSRLEKQSGEPELHLWVRGGRTTFVAYRDKRRQETIRFEFRTSRDCYLTLISVDVTGEVRCDLLRPNFFARAGRDHCLPPLDEEPLYVYPPAGRDVIFALATAKPLQTSDIGTKSLREHGTSRVIELITRAIGPRQEKTDRPQKLSEVVHLAREGWAVAMVAVDTLPEE